MDFFGYISSFGSEPLPEAGHWAVYAALAVVGLFLARSAWKDLKRPDRVPADAGPHPRIGLFLETTLSLWVVALSCLTGWILAGGSLAALGFRVPEGAAGWMGLALSGAATVVLLLQYRMIGRSEEMRLQYATQLDQAQGYDWIRPASPREYRFFQVMAVTAGITEELIFRGFLIGVLSLWVSPWNAAILSVIIFVGAHVYQGISGMTRILPVSVALTVIFLLTGSLLPVMVLHAAVDVIGGAMMWRLRAYRGTTGRKELRIAGIA